MRSLSETIRKKYELGHALHMTDLENLNSILSNRAIFSHNLINTQRLNFVDISNESVQRGRADIIISCTDKPLHDYVPLYWGKKTPMVSALRTRNETLIFLMFSTNLLAEYDCVITDSNARSSGTRFASYTQLSDLELLKPKDINTAKYAYDDEIKRRKQSELLVLNKLPLKHLLYIVCYSHTVKSKVEPILATHSVTVDVYIGAGNYYY
jgi:hypothetical protein